MSAFTALKKRTKKSFAANQEKVEQQNTGNNYNDDRFWTYQADDAGQAQVTMRFLPLWDGGDETKDSPIVEVFSHAFKGTTGQWYIDDCRSTLEGGKINAGECPVCDDNSSYCEGLGGWKAMSAVEQNRVRSGGDYGRGRRKQYVANIYIVNDRANPENNGKVMLWKFGPALKKIIDTAIVPEFDDEDPKDPFDLWEGCNFNLRVRKVEDQINYAKSSFEGASQLLPTDPELEEVWKKGISLHEFIDPLKFNSSEKQQARFDLVESGDKKKADDKPVAKEKAPDKEAEAKVEPEAEEEADGFFDDLLDD